MKKLVMFLALFVSIYGFAQNETLFGQGKEFYKNGKYQQAIESWKEILDNGQVSAALYFNLGNAEYKLNRIGPSIYYYEKALQLSPNDPDIKNNLAFAENARIDAIEPLPQSVFNKWYHNVADVFTFNGWAVLAVVFCFLFAGLFLWYYFSHVERKKRLLFASFLLAGLLFIIAITIAFVTYNDYVHKQPAIIFASEIEVKSEPSLGSSSAFVLHEGTKVQIIAQDGNWYRILLADGKDGWVPASDLKQL